MNDNTTINLPSTEEIAEIWSNTAAEEAACKKNNQEILQAVRRDRGEIFFTELTELIQECDLGHWPFVIVMVPRGDYQDEREDFPTLQGHWCYQRKAGEDRYAGLVTVKLTEGQYIEMPFAD